MRQKNLKSWGYCPAEAWHNLSKIRSILERIMDVDFWVKEYTYDTNELIYKTETDYKHREQTCGCQGVGEGCNGSLGLADANYYI